MSALAQAQRAFMRALFDDGDAGPGIEVYRSSVMANYEGALAATYPVVRRLVGDEFFSAVARRYARGEASTSGDLNDYGRAFAAFLQSHPAAASVECLADVARLEWACHESERSAPAPAFDFEALARVRPDSYAALRLRLDPSLRLVRSPHAIAAIHAANQPGLDGTPDREGGPDFVVVRRVEGRARVERFEERDWRLLEQLAAGEPLGRAAEAFAGSDAAALAQVLARFVANGTLCGFASPCA